jgi:hypothetical protein
MDLRQGMEVDIRDIKGYMTATGGFHLAALEKESRYYLANACNRS